MERISRVRAIIMLLIVSMILGMFSVRLFTLQIIETDGDTDNTQTYTTLTRVKAARGDILDRNGNILVGNRASYDLVFNHYVIKSADNRNEHLYKLVKKCQELGVVYNDHFPVSKTYPFTYTLDDFNDSWNKYFQLYMVDRSLDSDISAPLLMQTLRERYDIPEEWSEEDARSVIALRYEFDLRGVVGTLSNYVFVEDISNENLSILLEMNIPGLMPESSTVREYYTTYAAHILGSVGAIDADEWAYYKDQDYAMDAYVGKSGFEQAFESDLRAIDGTRVDVVDKNGTIISQYYANEYKDGVLVGQQVPKAGANVETTIDIVLQKVAEDALAKKMQELRDPMVNTTGIGLDAEGAAVIVLEVKTGEVLVCASYPTFDLATLNDNYDTIEQADFAPLFNRALSGAYPPGSTYKMVTLTSAMENGKYLLGEEIITEGVFTKYDNFRPTCVIWSHNPGLTHRKLDGTPGIDATIALEVSCNYFFYELGDRLTINELDETAKGFGLGELTGVELPEITGHRSNPESKAAQNYTGTLSSWFTGDRILTSIGQSENRFTPMQLCVYVATLANKGTRLRATFLSRVVTSDYTALVRESSPEIMSVMDLDDSTWRTYFQGMRQAVSGPRGTSRNSFGGPTDYALDANGLWPYPEIEVCAKTGTAETFKDRSDNSAYICFAPMNDPEIAIAIYGERTGSGGSFASVAEEIMRAYFSLGDSGDVTVQENKLG